MSKVAKLYPDKMLKPLRQSLSFSHPDKYYQSFSHELHLPPVKLSVTYACLQHIQMNLKSGFNWIPNPHIDATRVSIFRYKNTRIFLSTDIITL